MVFTRMSTRNKGIQTLDLVSEPMLDQKIERAIGHGWLRSKPCLAQQLQYGVGAKRPMLTKQELQSLPAHRRQAPTLVGTPGFRGTQGRVYTEAVVMLGEPNGHSIVGR